MQPKNINKQQPNSSVDLLTAILIEYPAINKVTLNNSTLNLFFLVQRNIMQKEWDEKFKSIQQQFRVFNKLEGYKNCYLEITKENYKDLTKIKLSSKLKQLNAEKIRIIVTIFKRLFSSELLQEKSNSYQNRSTSLKELLKVAENENINNYLAYKVRNKIFIYG